MSIIKPNQRLNKLVDDVNFKIVQLDIKRLNDDWYETINNENTYTIYVDSTNKESIEKDIQQFLSDEFLYDLEDREDVDTIKLKEFNIDSDTGEGSLVIEILYL